MMIRRILGLTLAWFIAASTEAALAAGPHPQVPITLVNSTKLPVYATAVALDEKELDAKLGVPTGTPLRVTSADRKTVLPLSRGTDDGRPVVWLYASLPPLSRLGLMAEPAASWPGESPVEARCAPDGATALLRNGVASFAWGAKGWDFGFQLFGDRQRHLLVENGGTDFWIDRQNRGRILNSDPRDLGLGHFADAKLAHCEAVVTADGRPTLRRTHRLDRFASAMTVTETFELTPGYPLLVYRIRWQNDGDSPLWVAYVGSGDGVKGKWSRPLLAGPLIERKKSAIQGDLGGGETRSAWLGGLCRISMESPATGCGLGMSTLLPTPGKVGTGSMIWGCGGGGFQCNFIDPGQGQFPFLVKPREGLDNGFAFLAAQTGTSVFRETVELWKTIQTGRLPRLHSPCAVFVDGEPREAQTVSSLPDMPSLFVAKGNHRRAAVRIDFNKYYEGRVVVRAASPQEPVEVTAQPMSGGKTIELRSAEKPGEYTIDLNGKFKTDEIPLVLEIHAASADSAVGFSINEILPVRPEVLSPVPDAAVTDFAAMFRWKAIPMVVDYDLQLSRRADFAEPMDVRITSSQDSPWYMPPDDKLPGPGTWHWRLRGCKGELRGAWSDARRMTVDDDHAMRPLKRPLTSESPLFTLEATNVIDFTRFRPDVPADIAPYVGIIAEGMEGKGVPVTDFARDMEKLPHAIMLRSHWISLADIEWLFQHVPNFIGIQGGEHLSSLYRGGSDGEMIYHHRLTRLCAKYGMIYQEADGTYKDDKWQELMERQGAFVRRYGRYLVLSQKNNIIRRQFYSQSCAMGLWLGGITHQHGAWEDGGFYWQNAGFKGLGTCTGERTGVLATMPRIFWTLNFVMGVGRGCGIYSADGQTLMYSAKAAARDPKGPWPSAIWSDSGKTTDTFSRFVVPLVRGVVAHRLIPTKQQVLARVKLAVYNDKKAVGDAKTWPHYVEYGPLYAATYGFRKMGDIDGQLWEFFPNSGRYYFIPVLPQGSEPLGPGVRNVPVSELQDVAAGKALFDAAYPAWYQGDALVCRVGDTLTVLNSRENDDVTESYAVPLGGEAFKTLSGKVGPHAYLVGKLEERGRRLWLQANTEYPDRDTELSIVCIRKPEWRIEPAAAAKAAAWDEASKTLKLRLVHRQGAAEITVE